MVTKMNRIEAKTPQKAAAAPPANEPRTESNRPAAPSVGQGKKGGKKQPQPNAKGTSDNDSTNKSSPPAPIAASSSPKPPPIPMESLKRNGGSRPQTPRSAPGSVKGAEDLTAANWQPSHHYTPDDELTVIELERRKRREAAIKALESEFDFLAVPDWIHLHPLLGAYLAEGLGTFFFVLTIALVVVNNPTVKGRPETNIDSIPIGFMLMSMVFTFGYISGGHFNPAITFAVMLARKMNIFRGLMYIAIQCGASLGAGIIAMIIVGSNDIVVPTVQNNGTYIRKGLFAELIYTFALATVVLNVAYSQQRKNFFYGFAIGMTVMAGVASVGGVSGGAFNPAVATGLQVAVCLVGNCEPLLHFWLYWAAPAVGAILATVLFMVMWQPGDDGNEEEIAEERLRESTA